MSNLILWCFKKCVSLTQKFYWAAEHITHDTVILVRNKITPVLLTTPQTLFCPILAGKFVQQGWLHQAYVQVAYYGGNHIDLKQKSRWSVITMHLPTPSITI